MNTAENRNVMPKLAEPEPIATPDPLDIEPLPNSKMFSKPKASKPRDSNKVKIVVEEKKIDEPIEAPLKLEKPAKKARKKRVLSEAHKKKLAEGRKKGLATRRARAAERKARASALLQEKMEKKVNLKATKIEKEEQRTLKLARKLKNENIRKEYESRQIKNTTADPDLEFQKFYKMMSRYENIRNNQIAKHKKKVAQAKPKQTAQRQPQRQNPYYQQPIRRQQYQQPMNSYRQQPMRRGQLKKQQSSNNPYSEYFF